jgi:4-hydroxythreonine-4-phosphate dehydrogenase
LPSPEPRILNSDSPVIAITSGEPAGIGPELCARLAAQEFGARLVVIGDRELLRSRAILIGAQIKIVDFDPAAKYSGPGTLAVVHLPLAVGSEPGKVDKANAAYVLALVDRALQGCTSGEFNAMVTAPVHKAVINLAGIAFTGHTEYLAEKTGTPRVVMLLVGGGLRVALATTHLALSAVPAAITRADLALTLRILHHDLISKFGIAAPRILVAGLNPHAGEGGYLGREEIEVITPVLDALRAEGMNLTGPLPADTLFTPQHLKHADCALAMYHDQGLSVLKYASFGEGVNLTLGLPVIRASVDHGTALDIAGTGRADPGSLFAAVRLACELADRQTRRAAGMEAVPHAQAG